MKTGISTSITINGKRCTFGKARFRKWIVVFCNFNPANETLFLDYIGNVERATSESWATGSFIINVGRNVHYGTLCEIIKEAMTFLKND